MINRRIPSLNWLRVFEMAARTESFARAAEALNMSPSAVSQQVRALETWLGRDLFDRQARAVRLTEAGRAFLPVVGNAIGSVEATAASLFGRQGAKPLIVRASALLAAGWLAPRIGRFIKAHPQVQLSLVSALSDDDFRRPDADLSITFGLPAGPGQTGIPLFGETLIPVATPDLAAQIATPADLLRHPLIEVASHQATWFRLLPEPALWPEQPRFIYTDTTLIALAAASTGGGIALARAPATNALVDRYALVPCLEGHSAFGVESYHIVHADRPFLNSAAESFIEWVKQEASTAALDAPTQSGARCARPAGSRDGLEQSRL
jgi:LysR family glycine cleavage system transcriptional activator